MNPRVLALLQRERPRILSLYQDYVHFETNAKTVKEAKEALAVAFPKAYPKRAGAKLSKTTCSAAVVRPVCIKDLVDFGLLQPKFSRGWQAARIIKALEQNDNSAAV